MPKLRLMLTVCSMCLFGSVAHAEGDLQHWKDVAIAECIAGRVGRPPASPEFCACWVNQWVELWNDNDIEVFSRGIGATTPHMHDTENAAANQCGG